MNEISKDVELHIFNLNVQEVLLSDFIEFVS